MFKAKFKHLFLMFIFILFSCQPVEILDEIVFEYNQLPKIIISADQKIVKELYESKFVEPYIDHSLDRPPLYYLKEWFKNNLNIIGKENSFVIHVIDASLKKSEIQNINSKKYEEKNIFLFEISFLVEYVLYDDSNLLLANSIVEAKRTTTSSKFISLMEMEQIINVLILDCLKDFSIKSEELIELHMNNFVL